SARIRDRADHAARLGRAARRQAAAATRATDRPAGATAAVVASVRLQIRKRPPMAGGFFWISSNRRTRGAALLFCCSRPEGAGFRRHHALDRALSVLNVCQEGVTMDGHGERTAPAPCKSNPGIGVEGKVAFARHDRSWTEEFNAVTVAASVLQARGLAVH